MYDLYLKRTIIDSGTNCLKKLAKIMQDAFSSNDKSTYFSKIKNNVSRYGGTKHNQNSPLFEEPLKTDEFLLGFYLPVHKRKPQSPIGKVRRSVPEDLTPGTKQSDVKKEENFRKRFNETLTIPFQYFQNILDNTPCKNPKV